MSKVYNKITYLHGKYEQLEQELKEERRKLQSACCSMSVQEFSTLSYSEMKDIYPILKENILIPSYMQEIDIAYKKKRIEIYPELKGPIYYPVLSELKRLPFHVIKEIDTALGTLWTSKPGKPEHSIIEKRPFCRYVGISEDIYSKVMEFLHSKGIVVKEYEYTCDCGECKTYVSEDTYEAAKEYFCQSAEEQNKDRYAEHCTYVECKIDGSGSWINSIDTLETYSGVRYIKVAAPDRKHEEW